MADKKKEEMLQEIKTFMKIKDYYEILGIAKSAEDQQIKNAYRKLALRFHPDKNQTEGSKEVFKKVSNAYTTLIDAEKRANYDRYGPEETVQAQRHQQTYQYQQNRFNTQDEEFDFIFRQFFGGGGAMFFQPQQQHRPNPQQRERQQVNANNMKWMLVFLLILIFLPKLFERKPDYQVSYGSEYSHHRATPKLNNKYYVREGFTEEMKNNPNRIKEIEREVDYEYLVRIMNLCENAKRMKQNYNQNAAMSIFENSKTYYKKLSDAVDISSCTRLNDLQNTHPQYISQLVYLR